MQKSVVLTSLLLFIILASVAQAAPPTQTDEGHVYIVQANDWLSKLADKFYGDPLAWEIIWQATEKKALEDDSFDLIIDPNLIEVGQKLWIPTINYPDVPTAILTVQDGIVSGPATSLLAGLAAPAALWKTRGLLVDNHAFRLWTRDCTGDGRYKQCDSGLNIVNMADPATPIVSTYTPPGIASDIVKAGNYIYVSWHEADTLGFGGVKILDVSDIFHPAEVGEYEIRLWVRRLLLYRQYVYLFTPLGLEIVDVAHPGAPERVGSLSSGVPINGTIEGNLLYLDWGTPCGWLSYPLECDHDLRVFDISNPATPVEIGAYAIRSKWRLDYYSPPEVQALVVLDSKAYVPIPSVDWAPDSFYSHTEMRPGYKYGWVVFCLGSSC